MKIEVRNLRKSFGRAIALDGVSLTFPSGELVALLGPSGSGKTTLLRIIAGIELPDQGSVLFDGEDVTDVPIGERHIGFVFQNYALFDHMTVADNIGFGLRVRGTAKDRIDARVRDLLGRMQLLGFESRMPSQLSGGQRQRVALARALAPEPRVLLLDEPFGALDARVRTELRAWIKRLHDELHITSILVTHDQDEAFEVASRVVLMSSGRVEQVGDPDSILDQPASAFVMDFVGHTNVLTGRRAGAGVDFGGVALPYDGDAADGASMAAYVRHQDVTLSRLANGTPHILGEIVQAQRIGLTVRVAIRAQEGGEIIVAQVPHDDWVALGLDKGDPVVASIRRAHIFSEVGGDGAGI